MQDIRKLIKARMKELGWTDYQMAQAVKDHAGQTTIYRYLSGESDIQAQKAAAMLEALGMEVRVK